VAFRQFVDCQPPLANDLSGDRLAIDRGELRHHCRRSRFSGDLLSRPLRRYHRRLSRRDGAGHRVRRPSRLQCVDASLGAAPAASLGMGRLYLVRHGVAGGIRAVDGQLASRASAQWRILCRRAPPRGGMARPVIIQSPLTVPTKSRTIIRLFASSRNPSTRASERARSQSCGPIRARSP
jgi:hypothetical protein